VWFGVIVGAVIAVSAGAIGLVFTGSPALAALILPALLVLAAAQPVAGVVFVLDGVLIGAGDAAYLALAGVANLVVFLPALLIVSFTGVAGAGGLAWLAASFFGVYLCARLLTLGWRVRGTAWQRLGAH
jgi:Na+-driven multidrug efflux pump